MTTADIPNYVAFVVHGKVRGIISLRRANRREVNRYVQSLHETDCLHAYRG